MAHKRVSRQLVGDKVEPRNKNSLKMIKALEYFQGLNLSVFLVPRAGFEPARGGSPEGF